MRFEYYKIDGVNCVVRSISKLLNKNYKVVKKELLELSKKLGYDFYSEIEVFEKYLANYNYYDIKTKYKGKIKDLNIDGECIVFCYDKKDFYHLAYIKDNILYDSVEENKELYVIKVYKRSDKYAL